MTNRGVLAAGAVLLLANGVILLNVARNHAGNPDAVVRLSERELHSTFTPDSGTEGMLELRLSWETALGPDGQTTWFDRARLEALGTSRLPAVGDTTFTRRAPETSRKGYAVLELAGPAWERWEALQQARRDSMRAAGADSTTAPEVVATPGAHVHGAPPPRASSLPSTRLFAVDFGRDPAALREQYPDRSRYLILPATYQADITLPVRDTARVVTHPTTVTGRISQLLPGSVHVPRPLRDSLIGLGAFQRDSTTHFEVNYVVGRRWEAWVE